MKMKLWIYTVIYLTLLESAIGTVIYIINFVKAFTQISNTRAYWNQICLARSIGLPSKKVLAKWDPQSPEIEKFGKGTQGKRKQQVRKSDWGIVKSSHLRCELLEACS